MRPLEMIIAQVLGLFGHSEAPRGEPPLRELEPPSGHRGGQQGTDPRRARPHQYQAFIAHAHGEDRGLAQLLARELSRFQRGARETEIYLDPNHAGTTETPWKAIISRLGASAHLVYLASPAAAKSKRCKKVIDYWLARRPSASVTLVLTIGLIRWDEAKQAFDPTWTDVLPPRLLAICGDEPACIDLRPGAAAGRESGTHRRDAIGQLAARVFGCRWEDLVWESMDSRRQVESELHALRGEVSLLRQDPAGAVREWVEAYRTRPTFDVLMQLVGTYHRHCLPIARPWELRFWPRVAAYTVASGLVIGAGRSQSEEGSLVCMDPLDGGLLWSTSRLESLRARGFGAHDGRLYFLSCTPDDKWESAAPVLIPQHGHSGSSQEHRITCFDARTKGLHHLAAVSYPDGLAIDRHGARLAVSVGGDIHLCALDAGAPDPGLEVVRSFDRVMIRDTINELAFVDSLGALAFCSGDDSMLHYSGDAVGLLDLATGEKIWSVSLHKKQVNTISLSPDQTRLVSASNDGMLAVWDVADGKALQHWRAGEEPVKAARFTSSGQRIVSITQSGAQVWDAKTAALLRAIPGDCGSLVMDPTRERFWMLGKVAVCIDLGATRRIATLNDLGTLIGDVTFDADGRHALAASRSSGWSGAIRLDVYDAHTGIRIARCSPGADHTSLYRAELSATGRYLLCDTGIVSQKEDSDSWRSTDSETILFDARSGATLARFETNRRITLDPKERCYVAVMRDELVFEALEGENRWLAWQHPPGTILKIAWHPGGDLLALKLATVDETYCCQFLRIDWEARSIDDHWPAVPVPAHAGRFEFDLAEQRLYVTGEGGSDLAIEPGRAPGIEVPSSDLRSARTAAYWRKRSVRCLTTEQLPHRDPYLYALDGRTVGAMRSDLLDRTTDISPETEQFLEEILASV